MALPACLGKRLHHTVTQKIRAYWGIENGLHYRRDVTLREDRTRMIKGNAGRIVACLNNLVIGLVFPKTKYAYLPHARRFFDAYPAHAFALIRNASR